MTRRLPLLAALLCALLLAALQLAPPASAHDELVGSVPATGSTVTSLPDQITLKFAEPIAHPELARVVVTAPGGAQISQGKPQQQGSDVLQAIRPSTQPGRYQVAFRILSDDGHPVAGSATFVLATPGSQAAAAPHSTPAAGTTSGRGGKGSGAWPWVLGGLVAAGLVAAAATFSLGLRRARVPAGS